MAYRCVSTKETSFMVFGFYFISKFSLLHVILISNLRRMIWLCWQSRIISLSWHLGGFCIPWTLFASLLFKNKLSRIWFSCNVKLVFYITWWMKFLFGNGCRSLSWKSADDSQNHNRRVSVKILRIDLINGFIVICGIRK